MNIKPGAALPNGKKLHPVFSIMLQKNIDHKQMKHLSFTVRSRSKFAMIFLERLLLAKLYLLL